MNQNESKDKLRQNRIAQTWENPPDSILVCELKRCVDTSCTQQVRAFTSLGAFRTALATIQWLQCSFVGI